MKILFCARHFGYLRNYEAAIRGLAEAGHEIELAADREETIGAREMMERIAADHPAVTLSWLPAREGDAWLWLATRLRLALDNLRYLDSRYADAQQLRVRAEVRTPLLFRALMGFCERHFRPGLRLLGALLSWAEHAIPRSRALEEHIAASDPDLVLITPLVDLGSPQIDHLKAARALGKRTVLCVGSWDHLSSKAVLRIVPDHITVWNETQLGEIVDLHGVPRDQVVVTGAQCYDHWFDRGPTTSREQFLSELRLRTDRPMILWICSSLFRNSKPEAELVERWLRELRSSDDARLREAGVLIRPHPARLGEWRRTDLSEFGNVAFRGSNPIDEEARDLYYDSLFHADAIVGINTSAMVEAAIVDRPVLSFVDADYAHNQTGTIHWGYLDARQGGPLHIAGSLGEHLPMLRAILDDAGDFSERNRRFVVSFVRPHGRDRSGTAEFVGAVERFGTQPSPRRRTSPALAVVLRPFLYSILLLRRARYEGKRLIKRVQRSGRRTAKRARKSLRSAVKRYLGQPLRQHQDMALSKADRNRLRSRKMFERLEEVEDTKDEIRRLAASDRPIIVGPWLSEAGFELLYWIPFLNWVKAFGNLRNDRLVIVSRGGTATWYEHLSSRYADVFEFFTDAEFLAKNEERIAQQGGNQKHVTVADFDREIIDRVVESRGLGKVELLHPSLMYNLFRVFWRLQASVGLVQGYTEHRPITPPPLGALAAHLPDEYVAVKFYTNLSFPATEPNQRFVNEYLGSLAESHEVVLLNTGVRFDDHDDFSALARDRIHTLDGQMELANNLDVQTRVIAGAQAFVGTYGGFSYLAPLLGTDALAVYSDATMFRVDHLEIAKRVFNDLGAGSFVALDVRDLEVVRTALGFGRGRTTFQPI